MSDIKVAGYKAAGYKIAVLQNPCLREIDKKENINIGLFGFGCVGQGLYDVLQHSEGLKADIGKICVKDRTKPRKIDESFFTYDRNDVLNEREHNLIVELISDPEAALEIIIHSLTEGKDVVTANKKAIADNFELLYKLQLETDSSLLYEAACAGSIPIIRTLEEYYDNELLSSIRGILNGSSNYILTKMERESLALPEAIKLAQEKGFAELDPWLDIAGYDSKYKLCLLAAHAFGLILKPKDIFNFGIQNISAFDINYAGEKKSKVKLLACVKKSGEKYRAYVLPHFIPESSGFSGIDNEFNGIEVEGVYSDKQFFSGKGAGSHPTGSAVLSDISAITYNYKYGYKKLKKRTSEADYSKDFQYLDNDFTIKLYISYANKSDLKALEIDNIYEEYSSTNNNYVIAGVNFASLRNLPQNAGIFISAIEFN